MAATFDDMSRLVAGLSEDNLSAHRWYGGKGRPVRERQLRDGAPVPGEGDLWLLVVDISFEEGSPETYFLPVALTTSANKPDAILGALGRHSAVDALADEKLCERLLSPFHSQPTLRGRHGEFVFKTSPAFEEIVSRAGPARLLPAEQTNTLVRFGEGAMLKVFRRVRPGLNADLEVTYFLTTHTDFANIPRVAGLIEYVDQGHSHWPLATLQSFVPNQGNAWKVTLEHLRSYLDGKEDLADHAPLIARLGQRTGQLHAALASHSGTPDFAPEAVTGGDWAKWGGALLQELKESFEMLRVRADQLPDEVRAEADVVLAHEAQLAAAAQAFQDFGDRPHGVGELYKTRYHGDYHLGQVLVTRQDFVIIDFEGEPLRPIEQRRAKQLVLKDVAGMTRSFSYACHAVLRDLPGHGPRMLQWESAMRTAFLKAYREAVKSAVVPLIPADDNTFMELLKTFELEKALYELRYEIHNRPDWVRIPLSGIRHTLQSG